MKCESFDKKTTNWIGLWWHPEYQMYTSPAINLSTLKSFKGIVRISLKKNPFYNKVKNTPNYTMKITDSKSETGCELEIEDEEEDMTEVFTRKQVREIINDAVYAAKQGYGAYDILPEDTCKGTLIPTRLLD